MVGLSKKLLVLSEGTSHHVTGNKFLVTNLRAPNFAILYDILFKEMSYQQVSGKHTFIYIHISHIRVTFTAQNCTSGGRILNSFHLQMLFTFSLCSNVAKVK
jgi:hypothetical protein